jgi:hypothetical protein
MSHAWGEVELLDQYDQIDQFGFALSR